jgi:hypothetical protein
MYSTEHNTSAATCPAIKLNKPGKIILLAAFLNAFPASAHNLPLGDGKISTFPRSGYLMSCTQQWRRPATHRVPWIEGDQWDPAEKPSVGGEVDWPAHQLSISIEGNERVISANNLPDHATGTFPISPSDPVYRYDRNRNSIRPQHIVLRLPLNPALAAAPSCVPMGMIGFTTDGVALYNAIDNAGKDAAAHEVQDRCNGHPQRAGQYHYHGPSPCMPNADTSGLVGYSLDGFGIYGMKDPATGRTLHNDELDACHGTTTPVMWDGRQVNMYHYVLTPEYPYTIGCFRGTPVLTNLGPRPGMNGMGRGMPPPRGRAPISMQQGNRMPRNAMGPGTNPGQRLLRAADILGISPDTLRHALGPPPPNLEAASRNLGIDLETLRSALGPPPGMDN